MDAAVKKEFLSSHDVAINLLQSNPDSHILTLAEIYRNCSVERTEAIDLVNAFKKAMQNLYPPIAIIAKGNVPFTIKFLEEQI
ncbi:MAG: hypothetical protein PF572_02745 [Patescibacteria group bacterium]|jgi:hypothetical protein|nr:hypothetical protein [Patescibacteria group bacterium]